MSEYKRFISYIYNYEQQEKKNNVGYARVETRGNQCKITIHVQIRSITAGTLKAYGFVRKGTDLLGILLGDITLRNGTGDAQFMTLRNSIGETEYTFDQLGGVILYINNTKFFGTEWDDRPLEFEQFCLESDITEEEKRSIESMLLKTAEVTGEEKAMDEEDNDLEKPKSEDLDEAKLREADLEETELGDAKQREVDLEEAELGGSELEESVLSDMEREEADREESRIGENEAGVSESEELDTEGTGRKIAEASLENTIEKESAAAKSDLLYFSPVTLRDLENRFAYHVKNDFMLHGYRRFGHLGLMDLNNRKVLGVPGVFCKREQEVARNYGFENFLPRTRKSLQYGDFGYWYASIEYLK